MISRLGPRILTIALALAAATAFLGAGFALAQQSQTPTELWQEYPLQPEPGTQEPASGGAQVGEEPGAGGAPADGGAGGPTAAADEGGFPLLPIVVALLLVLLPGLGLLAHGRGLPGSVLLSGARSRLSRLPVALGGFRDVPAAARSRSVRLRERVGAVRRPSLLDRPRPGLSVRKLGVGFRDEGSDRRYPPAMARREQQRGLGPEAPREAARPAAKPAKPRKPKAPAPAAKKRPAEKPPPAKATQAAKPPKPSRPAKRARSADQRAVAAPKRSASPPPPKRKRPSPKQAPVEQEPVREPELPKLTPVAQEPVREPELPKLTPVAQEPVREPPPSVEDDTRAEPVLTCSIVWRRDGALSEFTAVSAGLQGHEFVVESSPEFEWLGGAVPPEAREAHAILVYKLIRGGWQPVAGEGPWYRQRFEQPVEVGVPESADR